MGKGLGIGVSFIQTSHMGPLPHWNSSTNTARETSWNACRSHLEVLQTPGGMTEFKWSMAALQGSQVYLCFGPLELRDRPGGEEVGRGEERVTNCVPA